jgi:hypothetical protein
MDFWWPSKNGIGQRKDAVKDKTSSTPHMKCLHQTLASLLEEP